MKKIILLLVLCATTSGAILAKEVKPKFFFCGANGICVFEMEGQRYGLQPKGVAMPEWPGGCDAAYLLGMQIDRFLEERIRSAKTVEIREIGAIQHRDIKGIEDPAYHEASILVDGQDLSQLLIQANLALTANGHQGTSKWCAAWPKASETEAKQGKRTQH